MLTLPYSRLWRLLVSTCAASVILAIPHVAYAASRTLAWDANTETNLAGYKVSYGTAPGSYTTTVDVGKVTQWTVSGLTAGTTYYFVVQAYNSSGMISQPSNAVNTVIQIVVQVGRLTYDPATGDWSQPLADDRGNTPAAVPGWITKSGDFNGDGAPDYFMYNATTGSWLKAVDNREGTFTFFGYQWAAGWTPYVADMDGDGKTDVFIYNRANGKWFRCLTIGNGMGDFAYTSGVWGAGWDITPADLNGDGRADLFLFNSNPAPDPNGGRWFRVFSVPGGLFSYAEGEIKWAADWTLTPGDYDGDGRTDMFLYRPNGQWFKVFFADTGTQYVGGTWATGWTIRGGDFNGDRVSDLFLYNQSTGNWFVATSQSGAFAFYPGVWAKSWQISSADFNRDGKTDLLLYNLGNGQWFEATSFAAGVFGFTTGTGPTGSLQIVR